MFIPSSIHFGPHLRKELCVRILLGDVLTVTYVNHLGELLVHDLRWCFDVAHPFQDFNLHGFFLGIIPGIQLDLFRVMFRKGRGLHVLVDCLVEVHLVHDQSMLLIWEPPGHVVNVLDLQEGNLVLASEHICYASEPISEDLAVAAFISEMVCVPHCEWGNDFRHTRRVDSELLRKFKERVHAVSVALG